MPSWPPGWPSGPGLRARAFSMMPRGRVAPEVVGGGGEPGAVSGTLGVGRLRSLQPGLLVRAGPA